MQSSIKIEVSLFGAFRELPNAFLTFALPYGASIGDVRTAMKKEMAKRHPDFAQKNLLDVSALADETKIFRNDETLLQDTKLAVLPPISGG